MTNQVVLYIRRGEAASDEALSWLNGLGREYPHTAEVREVDSLPAWKTAAGDILPVAEVNGKRLPIPFSATDLKSALALGRAIETYKKETAVPKPIQALSKAADQFPAWFSRHWLASFNILVGVYLGIAILPPLLIKLGAPQPAEWIYKIYGGACHQLGYRSFYLFGEKIAYPRDEFQQITGISPTNLWAAKAYIGDEIHGFKMALCERDIAIYGSIFLAGIAFHFLRRRLKALPTLWWIVLGILPMGLDGGTQLLSYLPYINTFFPARESTPLLRVLTGLLFGATSVWFAYPYVEESMQNDIATPVNSQAK